MHLIITAYHEGSLTSVHHFETPAAQVDTLHAYIRATVAAETLRTEHIPTTDARRLPVDWLTVPVEFAQALARVAATERSV